MAAIQLTLSRNPGVSKVGALAYSFGTAPLPGNSPAVSGDFQGGVFPSGVVSIPDGETVATISINTASGAVSGHRFGLSIRNASPNTTLREKPADPNKIGKEGIYWHEFANDRRVWMISQDIP